MQALRIEAYKILHYIDMLLRLWKTKLLFEKKCKASNENINSLIFGLEIEQPFFWQIYR